MRPALPRASSVGAILILAGVVPGCASTALDRDRAAQVLSGAKEFQGFQTVNLTLDAPVYFTQADNPVYEAALRAEWITGEYLPGGSGGRYRLTDSGRQMLSQPGWSASKAGSGQTLHIPVARREVQLVTGLSEIDKNNFLVEFNAVYRLTDIGEKWAKAGIDFTQIAAQRGRFNPGETAELQAHLRLYDDGWRVVNVTPRGSPLRF